MTRLLFLSTIVKLGKCMVGMVKIGQISDFSLKNFYIIT